MRERRFKTAWRVKAFCLVGLWLLKIYIEEKVLVTAFLQFFWPFEQSFTVGLKSLSNAKDRIHKAPKAPKAFWLLGRILTWILCAAEWTKSCGVCGSSGHLCPLEEMCSAWQVMTLLRDTAGLFLCGRWGVLIFEPIIIQKWWQNIQCHSDSPRRVMRELPFFFLEWWAKCWMSTPRFFNCFSSPLFLLIW